MAEKKSAAKAEASAEGDAGAGAAKKKKLIIIGGGVALLLLIAAAAAFFLLGGKKDEEAEKAKAEAEAAAAPPPPAVYASLGDPFTITLAAADKPHYMKVAISAMSHEKAAVADLGVHAPLVRSRLVTVLGSGDFDTLRTDEGKRALQAEVLKTLQDVLQAETGKPGIEQVYFTEFVLQ